MTHERGRPGSGGRAGALGKWLLLAAIAAGSDSAPVLAQAVDPREATAEETLGQAGAGALAKAQRYRGWKIDGFEIKGLDDLDEDLKPVLALAGKRRLIFWRDYGDFDPGNLVTDLTRSRVFLARHGYPSAHVTPRFEVDPSDKKVKIVFEVDPGAGVTVVKNRTVAFPQELEPLAEEVLELEEGERFSDEAAERRIAELLRILKENGYAFATVRSSLTRTDSTKVIVDFVVDAGEIYYFGSTSVRGISDDLVDVARRTVAIAPGTRYTPERIESANENLRLLDLFRQARVYTEPVADNRLQVIADLAERKMQSVNVRVGYWTEDGIRFAARYRHRNVLTKGRGLGLDANYSEFLRETSATYWRPTLFQSRTRGSLTLRGRRESEPGYLLRTLEVEAAASYIPSIRTTLRPSITLSLIDIEARTEPPTYDDPGPNLIFGAVQWVREGFDDRLNPRSGQRHSIRVEGGLPEFEPRLNYASLEPQQAFYLPLVKERLFLAARAHAGLLSPHRDASFFLPDKRFYAGGAASVRGFERRSLGPRDDEHRPIGGVALAEASVELRFPLVWRIEGAVFGDMGQVWARYEDIQPRDLRFAVGPGLSMNTPVGPVRGDLGIVVGPLRAGEPRSVFHLSIGNPF